MLTILQYLDLHILRERFPGVPFMALTATATPTAVKNIVTRLKMREDYLLLRSSFNRPNLSYNVTFKPPTRKVATQHMVNWIREKHPDSTGIIYCLSRENCDDLARELREKHGLSALPYHAGLEKEEKRKALGEWQAGILHIIVATVRGPYFSYSALHELADCIWHGVSLNESHCTVSTDQL